MVDWESDEMNAAMQDAFDNVFSVEHPNIKVEMWVPILITASR
ncbi:MAG: hypothetical protein ACLURV_13900 [Gallintestinimicrobium sp.]